MKWTFKNVQTYAAEFICGQWRKLACGSVVAMPYKHTDIWVVDLCHEAV